MRHKHITKRAFKTKCRECGKPVLYWECGVCGAKTFFSLPIYGKPIRHVCEKYLHPKLKKLPKWRTAKEQPERDPFDIKEIKLFYCPVCNKNFNGESALNDHIKQLKELDDDHYIFFERVLDMIDFSFKGEKDNDSDVSINTKSNIKTKAKPDKNYRVDLDMKLDLSNIEKIGAYGVRLKRKKMKKEK
ncbi:MAG: hypothetical protein ACTSWY_10975 [Promethearchaeota archaeon]